MEKVHNSRSKFGKNWNVDIFEIIAPSLTLAKTVPKSYLTFTLGLIQSYISQIWSKCCPYLTNISYIIKIKATFQSFYFGKKFRPPSLIKKQSTFWIVNFLIFGTDTPFVCFPFFQTFLVWMALLTPLIHCNRSLLLLILYLCLHRWKWFTSNNLGWVNPPKQR